jgi:calcineurin-like phosphoesterase family protein
MKLLILQASDIHLSSARYPENPVLNRVPQIMAAVRSLFLEPNGLGGVLLLATGDIAYAGLKEEYDLALPFFREIQNELKTLFPSSNHQTVFIPGNHDCNFKDDDAARRKLIEDPDPASLADGSIVMVATVVQKNYFTFCSKFRGDPKSVEGLDRLYKIHEFNVGDKRIVVRTLNSAWASTIPESRTLVLPVATLQDKLKVSPEPAVSITTLHHPYNWFEPNNARALRRLLEEISDVILTGHEHSASTYVKTGLTGEQNEYIEGGVLQESNDPTTSSFNLVVVDLDKQSQEIHHFEWNGELYELANEVVPQAFVRNKFRLKGEFEPNSAFEQILNDAEAAYTHPYKEKIQLDDVFIYPDCFELDEKHSKTTNRVVHGRDLITHILKKGTVVITASERAGKTAIGRTLFRDLRRNARIPLLLSGRDISPSSIKKVQKLLDSAFDNQYSGKLRTRYWQLGVESRAVIIDDYHRMPIVKDFRDSFIREMMQRFQVVILMGGNELRIQELMGHDRESRLLWDFNHCEVMGFGHRLRAEFIKKWYRIGREGQVEDETLVRKAIQLEKTISSILGHDLLPPYPVYLLLLLQQLESNNPHDTTAASYGRLYGAVVTAYLAKIGSREDLETNINYLTELAFHLFKEKKDHLDNASAVSWHANYCQRHMENLNYEPLRDDLVSAQVLQFRNDQLRFRYKAGYYYFVALYLSDNIAKPNIREEIRRLCGEFYREEAANIVVFLCHRSKDAIILDEVLATANKLFETFQEADILADTTFSSKLLIELVPPILEESDPEKNRLRALESRDKFLNTADDDEDVYSHKVEVEETENDAEARKAISEFNAAIKTIQIAGQILRNFGGRLEGPDKLKLTEACYALGLRILKLVYSGFQEHEVGLVGSAYLAIVENHKDIPPQKAQEIASALVFGLLRLSTLGLIKIVSTSVGLEKLAPVFAELLRIKSSVARRLIDLSIRLDHYSAFPVDQTLDLYKEVQGSLIAVDVLRQLVFNRFYYFSAPYDIKQSVCKKLEIKIQPIMLDRDHKKDK